MTLSTFYISRNPPDNPGPGTYSPKAPFGEGPKMSMRSRPKEKRREIEPQLRRLPSTLSTRGSSFGSRVIQRPPSPTPGPSTVAIPIGKDAPKFSLRSRHPEPKNTNPGPADYDVRRPTGGYVQTIGTGPRLDVIDPNLIVAPGTYDPPVLFQKKSPLTIGPSIPIPEPERNGPGPVYDMSYAIGSGGPHYSIPKSDRDQPIPLTVGPADYTIDREITNPKAVPINLKGRTPLPRGDICDYPYYHLGDTIVPHKITLKGRPETRYETPSPGPGVYEQPSSLRKRPISIGKRYPLKNPHEDNPSPAAYFDKPIPPATQSGFSIKGDSERPVIDYRRAAEAPGPGYYEEKSQFEKPQRQSRLTCRPMENFVPDTAAPFHDVPSTLGGPRFTIGHSRDCWPH